MPQMNASEPHVLVFGDAVALFLRATCHFLDAALNFQHLFSLSTAACCSFKQD